VRVWFVVFGVFLGLVMVLIVEVVFVVEEEDAGKGQFAVVDHSQQVEPVLVELPFLLLTPIAYVACHVHNCLKA